MKNSILKLLIVTMSLMTSFFALAQMPPGNLAATVVNGNDVNLTWDAPVLLSEIAYDDGDSEGGYMIENDRYMAVRMTMPEDGDVQQVALYFKSPFGVFDIKDIMVCPDDGTGLPDLGAFYHRFGITTIDNPDWQWYFYSLINPVALMANDDFWIVAQWPENATFPDAVFLGSDTTVPPAEDRNYFTSSTGEWVLLTDDNLMMRAYYSPPTKNYLGGGINVIQNTNSEEILKPISEIGNPENITMVMSSQSQTIVTGVDDLLGYNVYRNTVLVNYNTPNTYLDTDIPDGTYDYYITAVYDTGESDPSNTVTVTINTAGVNENFIHNTIIYPNPANDVVNIKSDLQILSISVYSLTGQIVANEFMQSDTYQFNTSNLKSGFYIFRIETAKGTINHSVIID